MTNAQYQLAIKNGIYFHALFRNIFWCVKIRNANAVLLSRGLFFQCNNEIRVIDVIQ